MERFELQCKHVMPREQNRVNRFKILEFNFITSGDINLECVLYPSRIFHQLNNKSCNLRGLWVLRKRWTGTFGDMSTIIPEWNWKIVKVDRFVCNEKVKEGGCRSRVSVTVIRLSAPKGLSVETSTSNPVLWENILSALPSEERPSGLHSLYINEHLINKDDTKKPSFRPHSFVFSGRTWLTKFLRGNRKRSADFMRMPLVCDFHLFSFFYKDARITTFASW